MKSSKTVCLCRLDSGLVPLLAVFAAAAQIGDREEAAAFHPRHDPRAELGQHTDVEAAIGVEQRGVRAVELHALAMDEGHGDAGSILAGIEDLLGFELRGVEAQLAPAHDGGGIAAQVEAVDGARGGVAGEGEEGLAAALPAREELHLAGAGQAHFILQASIQSVDLDLAGSVLEVSRDEAVVRHQRRIERLLLFGDDFAPVRRLGLREIDRDNPALGRVAGCMDVEQRALRPQRHIGGFQLVDQFHGLVRWILEILVIQQILRIVGGLHEDEQVAPVVGNLGLPEPLGPVGTFIDQAVVRLRLAQAVQVDFRIGVGAAQGLAGFGFGKAEIVEGVLAGRPGHGEELDPADGVGEVAPGFDVADVPLGPVGAGVGEAVGEQFTVAGGYHSGERGGAIGAQRVGIEKHAPGVFEPVGGVEHILVLQAVIAEEEIAGAGLLEPREALVVIEAGEALLEAGALGDSGEVGLR